MATRRPASASSSAMAPPMSPPPAITTSKFFVIFYAAPLACGSASRIAHGELASSCERTSAFFAAARARVQSPIFAASRASAMKLRSFDARSCWVAFSDLPSAEPMLCSATLKLWLVCCWAATASPALVLDLEILHAPAELFSSLRDRSLRARSHDQNELFSAVAGDDILAPRSRQHVLAYCTQHRVSRGVPERVVEALEVVDIDHHYTEGQAAAPGAALFPAERFLEVAAVMEAGQPVMHDLVLQAEVCLRQLPLRQ